MSKNTTCDCGGDLEIDKYASNPTKSAYECPDCGGIALHIDRRETAFTENADDLAYGWHGCHEDAEDEIPDRKIPDGLK